MSLVSGKYKISPLTSDILFVALASSKFDAQLILVKQDASSFDRLKWTYEKQGSGFEVYCDFSGSIFGATVKFVMGDEPVIAGTSSKQWTVTPVPASEDIYTVSLDGYAWAFKGGKVELQPLDTAYNTPSQQWAFYSI